MTPSQTSRRLVILESPFAGPDAAAVARNVDYARACLRDSLLRGEAPIASHLLYTQPGVLDDSVPSDRALGIDAGLAWRTVAQASVAYADLGISTGMRYGMEAAGRAGIPVETRVIGWSPAPVPSPSREADFGAALDALRAMVAGTSGRGAAKAIDLLVAIDAVKDAHDAERRDGRPWRPGFDAVVREQERLAIEFCAEIAGPKGRRGSPPDPVRLLEMAEALYRAEADALDRPAGS